jgi:hypothetical protein
MVELPLVAEKAVNLFALGSVRLALTALVQNEHFSVNGSFLMVIRVQARMEGSQICRQAVDSMKMSMLVS